MHEPAVNLCVHHTALLSSVNKNRGTEHFIITGSSVNKAAFVKRQLKMHSAVRRQETGGEEAWGGGGASVFPVRAMGTGPGFGYRGLITVVVQSCDGRDTLLLHRYL